MQYRTLGRTGIQVSAIAFGAGPVSGLMTGSDPDAQTAVVSAAIDAGINWFDTAPGYGQGTSERSLGQVLAELRLGSQVQIATKVRLLPEAYDEPADYVMRSIEESLERLQVPQVTLLQLHNGITTKRGDEANSITPHDILRCGGVVDAFQRVVQAGLVKHIGLTGTGHPAAMREVIRSGRFDTVQTPYNVLNPSAGSAQPVIGETDYGNIMADCADQNMGVFAIRIYAGGALLGQPPSAHTLKTPYFPLALYERDVARAREIQASLTEDVSLARYALEFALSHPAVSAAIIGFGSPNHVAEVAEI